MRILFLDLDTLRPDHLGCYGYQRNTSPHIDRIASEGVRFENYYCSDAPCLPSRAALMTGQHGIRTGIVGHGGTAADLRLEGETRSFTDRCGTANLPFIFRKAGMKTASVSPFSERHSAWWFNAGFNEVHNTGKRGMESAEEVTPTVLDWIDRNGSSDNWFLHVNYWDPHTPYRAPEEFGNPFENDPLPPWITEEVLMEHRQHVGPHSCRELAMYDDVGWSQYPRYPGEIKDMADLHRFMDGYDCGIRYMDEHIGRLFDALERQGVLDDLVVIITADHGENMGELGIYAEHATADHPTCRLPMIVRWPGVTRPHVATGLRYHFDLLPTLAELLNVDAHPSWDGISYAATLIEGSDCGRSELVLSQCAHVCQRSVRFGPWLYIRTYHDGYHLFPTDMLFNIGQDPHQQQNLAEQNPNVRQEAVFRLNEWHDAMVQSMPSDEDPLWTVMREGGPLHARGHLEKYCERLEATGRGHAVSELKRRHPREFLRSG